MGPSENNPTTGATGSIIIKLGVPGCGRYQPVKQPIEIKLAIVGWRGATNRQLIFSKINEWVNRYGKPSLIISGGATGIDTIAEEYASLSGIQTSIFNPEYIKYGRSAPLIRNSQIVNACTHLLAFPSATSKGTWDSIRKAGKAGKPYIIYTI